MQHKNKSRAPSRELIDMGKSAGKNSADLQAVTTDAKLEASPRAGHAKPDQRLETEVKYALVDPSPSGIVSYAGQEALEVVSNAPSRCFEAAAGLNSAQVRRAHA